MPQGLDVKLTGTGTRFKLYPQPRFLPGFEAPEIVWVSPPAGSVRAGPADDRMYVVDAFDKAPYEHTAGPPYRGPVDSPVPPDDHGHFDYLDEDTRAFGAAHLYAGVRRVLDIWEGYLGRPIVWHFQQHHKRLELIPYPRWNNAQAGYGFLETGSGFPKQGEATPFCLNFDVIAHETGHLIVFSVLGIPSDATLTAEYLGYHESASDTVAIISALHFDTVIARVLEGCQGNLFIENEVNRIAELSSSEEIRHACHGLKLSDCPDPNTPWHRLSQKERHKLGEPMTGAIFDMIVEIFQEVLVEERLISRTLADLASRAAGGTVDVEATKADFERAFAGRENAFGDALKRARDIVGERLARTWDEVSPDDLRFATVARKFLTIDRRLTGRRYQKLIRNCFLWREIGYGFSRGEA